MTAMTMNKPVADKDVLRSEYQRSVATYWNTNRSDPVNLRLGEVDGYYHHHYGVGEVDWSVLDGPETTRDDRTIRELHRLEHAQAELLLDHLGDVKPGDCVLDAYSVAKDLADDKPLCNMVLQVAGERGCSIQEAAEITVQLHNDLVHDFEAGHRALQGLPSLELQRFLRGLRAWMGGSFEWHDSNPRYRSAARRG
jgi:hypothetical protein